ncbi:MAG: hypothetical protein ACREIT_00570 [Tepidisphaeraceae bacterium]
MNRAAIRRPSDVDAEAILERLSTLQYLTPRKPVKDALGQAASELGFCPGAAETAARWLGVDDVSSVGRLRRTELAQLARSIHRFWRQASATPATQAV